MKKKLLLIFILFLSTLWSAERKWIIDDVQFIGNKAYKRSRLFKNMFSRSSCFLHNVPFYPDLLQDDLEDIKQFYKINGYLDAVVELNRIERDSTKHRVNIHIKIKEGWQTKIHTIQLSGNVKFSDNVLWPFIQMKPGEALQEKGLTKSRRDLQQFYLESGFIKASITPEINIDTLQHLAFLNFQIEENEQYDIGTIQISGLKKTKSFVVNRNLTFHEKEKIQYSRILESQRRLYMTGLFKSVYIGIDTLKEGSPPTGDISVIIDEAERKEINLLLGYGSTDRLRGQVEFQNQNLWGTGRQLGLKLKASYIQRNIETSFTDPWLFKIPVRMDANIFIRWQDEPGFSYQRYGGKIILGHQFSPQFQIKCEGRMDWTEYLKIKISRSETETKNRIRGVKLSAVLDNRDNLYNPKKGLYLEVNGEFGRVFSTGDDQFIRLQFDSRVFINAGILGTIGSAVDFGWMVMSKGFEAIPLEERYFSGGPNSIRGFKYRHVGPKDNKGTPTGGSVRLVCHLLEIRKPVWRLLGMSAFLDMGQVWENRQDFTLSNVRWSAGCGIRMITPIGVIRLDYGHLLNPEIAETPGRWMFNIGHVF